MNPTSNDKEAVHDKTKQCSPDKGSSPEMFDAISTTYDFLNRLLSLGRDSYWRRHLTKHIPQGAEKILDCATGTGDQLLVTLKKIPSCKVAYGIDPSANMLTKAREKVHKTPHGGKVELFLARAHALPFKEAYFDAITMSFGIRNVEDVLHTLKELRRVLKPGGKILLLEFSLPSSKFLRLGHKLYLKFIVPFIGRLISKNPSAYRYLADTIELFPYGQAFCDLMQEAGFSKCKAHPLTFGITTVYSAYAD
jgi:demethylmenaquinone methyltransferase / 2-methoxy-6-polyprenyl-1,4-benzoquinol methylase